MPTFHSQSSQRFLVEYYSKNGFHEGLSAWVSRDLYTPRPDVESEMTTRDLEPNS